jgi:hypothetical protein
MFVLVESDSVQTIRLYWLSGGMIGVIVIHNERARLELVLNDV